MLRLPPPASPPALSRKYSKHRRFRGAGLLACVLPGSRTPAERRPQSPRHDRPLLSLLSSLTARCPPQSLGSATRLGKMKKIVKRERWIVKRPPSFPRFLSTLHTPQRFFPPPSSLRPPRLSSPSPSLVFYRPPSKFSVPGRLRAPANPFHSATNILLSIIYAIYPGLARDV